MNTRGPDRSGTGASVAELADRELGEVSGGINKYHDESADKYYEWTGRGNDGKYLCPNCRRTVHLGSWLRYYCDPCNASWLYESSLVPNIAGGSWKQITKEEYDTSDCPFPFA